MTIDGRTLSNDDLMRTLRDAIRTRLCTEPVDVIVADKSEAARVKAYMKMSGLKVQTLKREGQWDVQGSGEGCGCK